jgi:hypothetical protein
MKCINYLFFLIKLFAITLIFKYFSLPLDEWVLLLGILTETKIKVDLKTPNGEIINIDFEKS